ncbi:MAG: hypothetical protein M1827_006149 [Pycnora praestabilis]|nr:MAG: hypothetical protein M1827_006149 [Pycnora praestabilis]
MNPITYLTDFFQNFQRNLTISATKLSPQDWIRLVAIVGAYCLLRPYLIKMGARFQEKDHERALHSNDLSSAAAISPNSLRGQVEVPEDSESEDDDGKGKGKGSGADWGKGARRKQRKMIRKILDAEELKREEQEDDEDKDIEEFLWRPIDVA